MTRLGGSQAIRFRRPPRSSSVLGGVLVGAGVAAAVAGCGHITPLGPAQGPRPTPVAVSNAVPVGIVHRLGAPIILQVMRSQSPSVTGGCGAGLIEVVLPPGAAPMPCFRPVGVQVTINTAAVSPVLTFKPAPPPGQSAQPASYGFTIGVLPAQITAVTGLIKQAYEARGALGVSVDGKLWQAAEVLQPFPGQQFQIALLTRNQAVQLYRLLVPSG